MCPCGRIGTLFLFLLSSREIHSKNEQPDTLIPRQEAEKLVAIRIASREPISIEPVLEQQYTLMRALFPGEKFSLQCQSRVSVSTYGIKRVVAKQFLDPQHCVLKRILDILF